MSSKEQVQVLRNDVSELSAELAPILSGLDKSQDPEEWALATYAAGALLHALYKSEGEESPMEPELAKIKELLQNLENTN